MSLDPANSKGVTLVGLDPGFASIGYAVCVCDRAEGKRRFRVARMGVIRTERSARKRSVRAADDNVRRARELAYALDHLFQAGAPQNTVTLDVPPIRVICAESMSFPPNAGSAAKVAMSWGVITALACLRGLAIVQASPQEIKQVLCSRKDASKEDVQAAVETRVGADLRDRIFNSDGKILQSKILAEHPYDALAAVLTCMSSEIVRALWR